MRRRTRLPVALVAVLVATALLAGCTGGGAPAAGRSSAARPTPSTTGAAPAPTATTAAPTSAAPPTARPPAPPPDTPETRADAVLAGLDRRGRVAQLFLVGVPLSGLAAGDALARSGVGGLFLNGRSTAPAADLGRTTAAWRAEAPGVRPWVAADQEGGLVQTFSGPGFADLPTALAQGQLPRDRLAALARDMGTSLRTAGVDLDLAPVADVVPAGTARANAPVGAFSRQYGSTPEQVSAAAGTVVAGLAAAGVHATLKHFPGLGRVTANTDTSAVVTDPVTSAGDPQVALFGTLARGPAAPFVMVSLATYPQLDPAQPAVFSPTVVTGLLRGRLGYTGVVVSDDVGAARAVAAVPAGQRAVRFLAAGGTLVLTVAAALLPEMEDAVLAAADADPAFAARVDAAARTALLAKARAGLL